MKGRQQQAAYAARTIHSFLDGSCGDYNWDDFISCPLRDPQVERIRRHAGGIDLPADEHGQAILLSLADETDRLAASNGS